jgi:hypothetical protein
VGVLRFSFTTARPADRADIRASSSTRSQKSRYVPCCALPTPGCMSEALWGFIGALVGAIAATGETMWVQWMQNRAAIRAQRLQIECAASDIGCRTCTSASRRIGRAIGGERVPVAGILDGPGGYRISLQCFTPVAGCGVG